MPNVQQNYRTAQHSEELEHIKFQVTSDFKLEVDRRVTEERTTLRDFCTRAIAEKLGIPVPGEDPAPSRRSGAVRKSTS